MDSSKRKAYDDELKREELLNYFRQFQEVSQKVRKPILGQHFYSSIAFFPGPRTCWSLYARCPWLGLSFNLCFFRVESVGSFLLALHMRKLMVRTLLERQDELPAGSVGTFMSGFILRK